MCAIGMRRRPAQIWVPSQFNRDTFVAGGVDAAKVRVVPEPVDTNFFDPIIASDLHDGLISPIKNTKSAVSLPSHPLCACRRTIYRPRAVREQGK